MLCIRPYRVRGMEFGCYKCKACRVNRRNMQTGRMMLELTRHDFACMATLTYKPEECPEELRPDHLRDFLKRLRYYVPRPFRFYAAGEYGGRYGRPHYHLALFSVCMSEYPMIERAWGKGFVHVGELNHNSAQYITKYVTKGYAELKKFEGKHPEFSRQSKPALGSVALDDVARNLMMAHGGSIQQEDVYDVPSEVRSGGYRYPLGTVLRRALRKKIGWEANAPAAVVKALSDEAERRTAEETELRERRRVAGYENLTGRLKIKRSMEKL